MARSTTIAIVASVLWLFAACGAHAAGLGRLSVLSALGQPLLAEVEIVALAPGEEDGLTARLAPAEAFNAAGIEISPALLGMKVDIARKNGRAVLRLTTKQAVNDPFLDLLVELQWPTGKLVREYTFLLDPPDYRKQEMIAAAPPPAPSESKHPAASPEPAQQAPMQPSAQAQPPAVVIAPAGQAEPPAEAKATPETRATSEEKAASPSAEQSVAPAPIEQKPLAPAAEAPAPAAEEAPAAQEASPAQEAPVATQQESKERTAKPATHTVKKGETLGDIARANLKPGVTLNQMLVAIFRANRDAFIHGNVNLVRTGKILNIPSGDDAGSIDSVDANQIVQAQNDEFTQYRSKLASAPSTVEGGPEREASGPIEAKPAAPPPAAPSDQVRLSKSEPGKPEGAASRAARADDAAAQERALQEAQSRTADLEKNVADLQKLLELKNQQLAELEKKAAAKPAPAVPQPPVQAPAPAVPMAKAPEKAAPAAVPAPSAPAAPPAVPQAKAPAAQPPQAAKPPAAMPPAPVAPAQKAQVPKPRPKPVPPAPEPGLLDEFLDTPLYLAALGAVVLLLVGYAVLSWRKKKAAHAKFQDSVLGAAAAGGGVAALHEPTATTSASVSQAPVSQAPAGMEAEEVDPIAEADVYMAYGRDAQAEEILKEALQKDASRTTVHGKLLEIYANRKDTKAFEQTALKLKGLTKGAGPEWEKAAALGRSIDPQNGVYGDTAAAPAAPAGAASAPAPTLDFDLGGASQGGPAAPDISLDEPGREPTSSSVDIELGATQTLKLDQQAPDRTLAAEPASGGGGLDFNLDLGGPEEKKAEAAPGGKPAEEPSGLDFNLDIGEQKSDAPPPPPQPIAAPPVDLGDISLDLGGPAGESAPQGGGDPKWQEVATKLDLAKAYEEMGDKDGARELLNEVAKDGDDAQKGQAQQLLAKLG